MMALKQNLELVMTYEFITMEVIAMLQPQLELEIYLLSLLMTYI